MKKRNKRKSKKKTRATWNHSKGSDRNQMTMGYFKLNGQGWEEEILPI